MILAGAKLRLGITMASYLRNGYQITYSTHRLVLSILLVHVLQSIHQLSLSHVLLYPGKYQG